MIAPLTPNTQAILLLTAPLIMGSGESSCDLLSPGEYNRLARILREKQLQPADLIGPDARNVLELCSQPFGQARLEALLGRGFLLSQAVDRWTTRSIWVVSRADTTYPQRIKEHLKENAPAILYGCGEIGLLDSGGLAVVGSRHVDDELIGFTENVGRLAAEAQCPIVSGGAKGIDRASMHGALQAGGIVVGVMADSLERAALTRDHREPLMDHKLVFISPYDPAAGFNVGHAMQRNKIIYALADAALVVTSDFEKGGTWAGAIEQLERLHFVPVFVRNAPLCGKGNTALLQQGAIPWPNPRDKNELRETLSTVAAAVAAEPKEETLLLQFDEVKAPLVMETTPNLPPVADTVAAEPSPQEELRLTVSRILSRALTQPRSEAEVAELLGVLKPQAKAWLLELLKEGILEKLSKPIRYRAVTASDRLL